MAVGVSLETIFLIALHNNTQPQFVIKRDLVTTVELRGWS